MIQKATCGNHVILDVLKLVVKQHIRTLSIPAVEKKKKKSASLPCLVALLEHAHLKMSWPKRKMRMGEELQAQLLLGKKHAGWSLLQKSWLALKKT